MRQSFKTIRPKVLERISKPHLLRCSHIRLRSCTTCTLPRLTWSRLVSEALKCVPIGGVIFLVGCSSAPTPSPKPYKIPEEISLKQDRKQLDELRAEIPPEQRELNDEWALILKDMDGSKSPYEVRSRFYDKTRKHRDSFNQKMRKAREDFNKSEQINRKKFLDQLAKERKDFDIKEADSSEKKAFFEDHSDRRKLFFEEQKDQRKEFDSIMDQKRKDFDEHLKEKQKQFDDAIKEYTKSFEEKKKEKAKLENAKLEAKRRFEVKGSEAAQPDYPGRDKDLQDLKKSQPSNSQLLVPDDE